MSGGKGKRRREVKFASPPAPVTAEANPDDNPVPNGGDNPSADPMKPVQQHPLDDAEYDEQGRRLCQAKRRDGGLCRAPAMTGQARCRGHGGGSPQAKRAARIRLAELVDPAIATLGREMVKADKSVDRQRAANSILDRAGFGREQKLVDAADTAREILLTRLRELRRAAIEAGDGGEVIVDAEVIEEGNEDE